MSDEKEINPTDESFTDLSSFEAVVPCRSERNGNVIKGPNMVAGGVRVIEMVDGVGDRPSIVVHRVDERIESLEFICKCGRGTLVRLEYDGE